MTEISSEGLIFFNPVSKRTQNFLHWPEYVNLEFQAFLSDISHTLGIYLLLYYVDLEQKKGAMISKLPNVYFGSMYHKVVVK